MSIPLQIFYHDRPVFTGALDDALELGRQQHHETDIALLQVNSGSEQQGPRLVLAPLAETRIGRRQLLIEEVADGLVRLHNLSPIVPVEVTGRGELDPESEQTLPIPVEVVLPSNHRILIGGPSSANTLQSLGLATCAPGQHLDQFVAKSIDQLDLAGSDVEQLVQLLQAAMDVFQSARTQEQLFKSAVQGARTMVGMNRAVVVMLRDGKWIPNWTESVQQPWRISESVLWKVHAGKQTFWDSTAFDASKTSTNVEGVIAAPVLNIDGEVIGALYGECQRKRLESGPEVISRVQARLMELLSCGVSSGLSRIEQEVRAINMKLQFEQYFTKKLAEELELNPTLIDGRDADVTVLFCDIRRFSRISERIGTKQTFQWINDVMEVLSLCVNRHDGVLVDYIGDELMAMWGAPKPQTDHASLACRAAIDMLSSLPEIERRWSETLGEPLEVGIGINSGQVRAGNTGSNFKFKYSPLGTTVNLASRLEGATKYLRTPALISGETSRLVDADISRRRLCQVKVVNIDEPVPLYELAGSSCDPELVAGYETALAAFEQKDFTKAANSLTGLLQSFPNDGPSLVLLSRTVHSMINGAEAEHPVWVLPAK
ncbi:adenylate/guanylate cyclase domain-containing protein [Thalassoglobus sp. JC818]|uniref:adenylate/guanylate cyclase domain-containing protein n=1 Tax=Thalassoglobus sp. JC818 TaxID=3232136 RepID=UPI00345839D3